MNKSLEGKALCLLSDTILGSTYKEMMSHYIPVGMLCLFLNDSSKVSGNCILKCSLMNLICYIWRKKWKMLIIMGQLWKSWTVKPLLGKKIVHKFIMISLEGDLEEKAFHHFVIYTTKSYTWEYLLNKFLKNMCIIYFMFSI